MSLRQSLFTRPTLGLKDILTLMIVSAERDCIGGEALAAVRFEMPSYPKSAFRKGQQGWTIIRLDIAEDGSTENIRVERSLPNGYFDKASIQAVEDWQFRAPKAALANCRVLLRYRAGEVTLGA